MLSFVLIEIQWNGKARWGRHDFIVTHQTAGEKYAIAFSQGLPAWGKWEMVVILLEIWVTWYIHNFLKFFLPTGEGVDGPVLGCRPQRTAVVQFPHWKVGGSPPNIWLAAWHYICTDLDLLGTSRRWTYLRVSSVVAYKKGNVATWFPTQVCCTHTLLGSLEGSSHPVLDECQSCQFVVALPLPFDLDFVKPFKTISWLLKTTLTPQKWQVGLTQDTYSCKVEEQILKYKTSMKHTGEHCTLPCTNASCKIMWTPSECSSCFTL